MSLLKKAQLLPIKEQILSGRKTEFLVLTPFSVESGL